MPLFTSTASYYLSEINAIECLNALELILNQEQKSFTLIRCTNRMRFGDHSKWAENFICHLNKINKHVYNFIIAQGYKLKLKDDILIFENPRMMELTSNSLAKIPLNFQNLLRDQMNISE